MPPTDDRPQTPDPARLARVAQWSLVTGVLSIALLAPVILLFVVSDVLDLYEQFAFLYEEVPGIVLSGMVIGGLAAAIAAVVCGSIGAHESNDYNRGFARLGRLLGLITLVLVILFLDPPNF